ncbi:MAG: hypothetical protein SWH61_09680 [Thermodesulfobacteriota bacterium]|nr:hypothetical protein [Thermodesulfobacteriota bacterium]
MHTTHRHCHGIKTTLRRSGIVPVHLLFCVVALLFLCLSPIMAGAVDCDGDGTDDLLDSVAGGYFGELSGTVTAPVTTNVDGTWTFDVGEDLEMSINVAGIPYLGAMLITGSGSLDPDTCLAEMSFDVPIMGTCAGTGGVDCDRNFFFEIPSLGFEMTGNLGLSGVVSGEWGFAFDYSVPLVGAIEIAASGTLSGSAGYTITASACGAGSVSPEGDVVVPMGDSQAFTFTPDDDCSVQDILVDGVSVGPAESYTFEDVSAGHTIEVIFGCVTGCDLLESVGGNYVGELTGTVTAPLAMDVTGDWQFEVGSTLNLDINVSGIPFIGGMAITGSGTLNPDTGDAVMAFDVPWVGSDIPGTGGVDCLGNFFFRIPDLGFIMTGALDADAAVQGEWEFSFMYNVPFIGELLVAASGDMVGSKGFIITATAIGAGTIEPSGEVICQAGGSQSFTFTPTGSCGIISVKADGETITPVEVTYRFDDIDQNHTLDVSFGAEGLLASVAGSYGGTVTGGVPLDEDLVVEGNWSLDAGVDGQVAMAITDIPIVESISAAGTIDPVTGFIEMTVSIPAPAGIPGVSLCLDGTGTIDCDHNITFGTESFGFLMEGTLEADGCASGTWQIGEGDWAPGGEFSGCVEQPVDTTGGADVEDESGDKAATGTDGSGAGCFIDTAANEKGLLGF